MSAVLLLALAYSILVLIAWLTRPRHIEVWQYLPAAGSFVIEDCTWDNGGGWTGYFSISNMSIRDDMFKNNVFVANDKD